MFPPKNEEEESVIKQQAQSKILEPVLQKYFTEDHLQITNYSEANLLQSGENYCSIMTKLDVIIRKNADAKEEQLHFVGKANAPSDKPVTIWPLIFKKELFVYAELLPMYRKLEREAGIAQNDLIDIAPGYIGHVNSSGNGKIDDSSILLMENMKFKNFYSLDRRIGLDVQHASKALTELARYHAIGIAMRKNEPPFTEIAIEHCKIIGIEEAIFAENYAGIYQTFKSYQPLSKHLDKIEFSLKALENLTSENLQDPWNTVTHGDFWVNNIMFHKNESGNVDDVKFVDFQMYLYNSALRDLPYFFCGSLDETTVTTHFDELLDIYYDNFIRTLKLMNCDTSFYMRENFDCELKKAEKNTFALNALCLKYFVFKVEEKDVENRELHKNVITSDLSQVYKERLMRLIQIYEARNWF